MFVSECLQTYGASFNFTLWYVRVIGDDDKNSVQQAVKELEEVIGVCLNHNKSHLEVSPRAVSARYSAILARRALQQHSTSCNV